MKYFDDWFKIYSRRISEERGITLNSYLSEIKDFSSFKSILTEVFSLDGSLANYVSGFDEESFRLFYNRSIIQDIIIANKGDDEEFFEDLVEEIPVDVQQTEKEVEEFFRGTFVEKETGKEKKVVAKKDSVKVRGKEMVRYRDSRGRFVKRV